MPSETPPISGRTPVSRAVRHHVVLVATLLVAGGVLGWLYAGSLATTYTSTARVLVDPAVGNPFVPTPTAVRQDELTSLETEAQVARSTEVLTEVARANPPLEPDTINRGLQITVPPNTQVLEISYSSSDPSLAKRVTDGVADAYLANRARRAEEVTTARIDRVESQTRTAVTDLRAATAAAQRGTPAARSFQAQLATALRNDLVSLRAQRSALETAESPAGSVLTPATAPQSPRNLEAMAAPVGGALAGLVLGCLLALLFERLRGVVRSPSDVEESGLPVAFAVPQPPRGRDLMRAERSEAFDDTVRRLRASILELDPKPDLIAVSGPADGEPVQQVSEALAASIARAGHRVVLVRTHAHAPTGDLVIEEGLAQALLYDRLDVVEMLHSTVEPLLCVLPAGELTAESRELMVADRLRAVLAPLVAAGNLVIIEGPSLDSAEGEAVVTAAALGLVVVTSGQARRGKVEQVGRRAGATGTTLAAVVVGRHDALRRSHLGGDKPEREPRFTAPSKRLGRMSRSPR